MAVSLISVNKNVSGNRRVHDIVVSWQTTTNFTFTPALVGLQEIDSFIPEVFQDSGNTLSMSYNRAGNELRSTLNGADASVGDTAVLLRARVTGH